MCVFKIQKWKWVKSSKLPWSIVKGIHTIVQIPYHTIVQTEKCHESSHIYSRRRNPTYIVVSLPDWLYVWHHIGIKKQQLDIIKRKSSRLAKAPVGVGELWSPCRIQPHCMFLCLVGANNGFHYFPMVEENVNRRILFCGTWSRQELTFQCP